MVFDEVHNLLAGNPREQRVILQLLRYLSNELKASLVCLGVMDARDAIAGDTQLSRRLDQIVLPRWKVDEEFHELVSAVLRSLPIKQPSALSSQGLRHLARISDGVTARVFAILNELAIEAIRAGTERSPMRTSSHGNPPLRRKPCSRDAQAKEGISSETQCKIVSHELPQIGPFVPIPGLNCQSTLREAEKNLSAVGPAPTPENPC